MTIGQPIIEHSLKHYIYLHQHPELSFQEYATNDHIKKQLKAWDIPYVTSGPTGITPKSVPMPKFLIIRFSSIGDIIQCMGIISGIKKKFPKAEIHWIARKDMSSFLAMDERIDKIWAYDKTSGLRGLWQMAYELRKEQYDYIYDAHSNIRSNILKSVLYSRIKHHPRTALRKKERRKRILLFRFRKNLFDWPFRGVESYRKPLSKWNITTFPDNYRNWHFPLHFSQQLDSFIVSNTVTLVPSANWPMKRWPIEHWQTLIRLLPDYRFIILAGPADTFCKEIEDVDPERVQNLAGKTSLLESCYLVRHSHIVVSGDTGFMHAADLFRVPVLALIGPTAFGFPSGPTAETFEIPLHCRPCTKDGRGKCKQPVYQKCMVDISPEKIANRLKCLLPLS